MVAAPSPARRPRGRAALIAADPAAWRPARPDVRPLVRQAIMRQGWPAGVRTWALWLADRMNGDGTLPDWCDRKWLTAKSGICPRTCSVYLAQLEAAGVIDRRHVGRKMPGSGEYRHAVIITAAAALVAQLSGTKPERPSENAADQRNGSTLHPTPHKSVTVGLHGLGFSDHVQAVTRASGDGDETRLAALGAQPRDLITEEQRAADRRLRAEHWPTLARSRTDLPALRPGLADGRFTAPPCRWGCGTRHSPLDLCPGEAAAVIALEGKF